MGKEVPLGNGLPIFQNRHDGSRVFVQLSENAGCPIGCKYCYLPNVGDEAKPIDYQTMASRLDALTASDAFTDETLVSLGCDTEPLLPAIIDSTAQALEHFRDRPNPIQLATKLRLPQFLLDVIGLRNPNSPPLQLSTSITTIHDASKLEPGAPDPAIRAENFRFNTEEDRIISIAMMKPYRRGTIREVQEFASLYSEIPPAGIVVGPLIAKTRPGSSRRPFALDPSRDHQALADEARQFSTELTQHMSDRSVEVPIWNSAAVAVRALNSVRNNEVQR